MISLDEIKDVFLFMGDTDFRNGIQGLTNIVLSNFNNDDYLNCLYVFCNKSKTQLKLLQFDNTGIWLYQKKLQTGKFIYPSGDSQAKIEKDDLKTILNGLDFLYKIGGSYGKKYDYF